MKYDKKTIDFMIESNRLKLNKRGLFSHYSLVLLLLILFGSTIYFSPEHQLNNPSPSTAYEPSFFDFFFLILAVILSFIQWKRLSFKSFDIKASPEEFHEALNRTINDLEWKVKHKTTRFIQVKKHWHMFGGHWGQMVTIIRLKNHVLINSISDPYDLHTPTSMGMNKVHIRTFMINLRNVVYGTHELKPEEDVDRNKQRRVRFRFFAYPFCLFLLIMSVYAFSIGNYYVGFGAAAVVLIYLSTDLGKRQ